MVLLDALELRRALRSSPRLLSFELLTLGMLVTRSARATRSSSPGADSAFHTSAFYTAKYGYKLCLRLYLNGDGTGKRTHLSLFIVIMRGEYDALLPWPFRNKVRAGRGRGRARGLVLSAFSVSPFIKQEPESTSSTHGHHESRG